MIEGYGDLRSKCTEVDRSELHLFNNLLCHDQHGQLVQLSKTQNMGFIILELRTMSGKPKVTDWRSFSWNGNTDNFHGFFVYTPIYIRRTGGVQSIL